MTVEGCNRRAKRSRGARSPAQTVRSAASGGDSGAPLSVAGRERGGPAVALLLAQLPVVELACRRCFCAGTAVGRLAT
jgi:hypothetical protein